MLLVNQVGSYKKIATSTDGWMDVWINKSMNGYITVIHFFFIASLWLMNPGTIRIFSNQVTVTFLIESDENDYIGFNATYTAFNSTELNSKYCLFFSL